MMIAKDYSGMRFGKLTVLRLSYVRKGHKYYTCQCDCGRIKDICGSHLATGASRSCGCMVREATIRRNTTHGQSKTRLFSIWSSMRERCSNKNLKAYKWYGGRGITVCPEWNESFENFKDWSMKNGYSESLSIDRINNDGNYEPNNCRWVGAKEQARNSRNNHVVTINGVSKIITEWFEESPVTHTTIYQRIKDGWEVQDAIMKPDQRKNRR